MVCNNISTGKKTHCRQRKGTRHKLSQCGMTIAEMMFGIAIAGLVLSAVASLAFYTGRSFVSMANYVELDQRSRNALDSMSREIRQANRLLSSTSTSLNFECLDGSVLSYVYDAPGKKLLCKRNNVEQGNPLLTGCDSLQFLIYQRNSVAGTYDQYPTASASTCKLVQLRWVCSRKILGVTMNTESVQSAKIVIRKQ